MPIKDYFSRDAIKRARFIFDLIAPLYGKIEKHQSDKYARIIDVLDDKISIEGKKVLDVGTGTGAWASMFVRKQAAEVYAVDLSPKMLNEGRKKYPSIKFIQGDAEDLTGLADNSFDIVTASYVLHGVKKDRRKKMLKEMKRISRKFIIIHDFSGHTDWAVLVLEFLERSDFRNFKTNFYNELKSLFPETEKIEPVKGSGLYFAMKK